MANFCSDGFSYYRCNHNLYSQKILSRNSRRIYLKLLNSIRKNGFYIEQIRDNYLIVLATTLLIGYSTIITRDIEMETEEKPFTSNIELLNGRMVMMGVLFKFIYDGTQYFHG